MSELYLFKKQCENSDQLLRKMLGKSPLCQTQLDLNKTTEYAEFAENVVIKPEESQSSNDFDGVDSVIIQLEKAKSDTYKNLELRKQEHQCTVCQKIFKRINHLKRHMKIHEPPENLPCDICSKTFSRFDLLQRHMTVHEVKSQLKDEEFGNGALQEVEMSDLPIVKEELSGFKCLACNCSFEDWESYVKHVEKGHPAMKYSCMTCFKKFTKNSHLKRHMRIHQVVKPYVCELCDKGFARLEQMVNHMNGHSGIKPHVCQICSKGNVIPLHFSIFVTINCLNFKIIMLFCSNLTMKHAFYKTLIEKPK